VDWRFDDLLFKYKCQAATIPNSRGSKTKIRAINPSPYNRRKQLDPAKSKSKLPHPQNTDFADKKKLID